MVKGKQRGFRSKKYKRGERGEGREERKKRTVLGIRERPNMINMRRLRPQSERRHPNRIEESGCRNGEDLVD
jgi:hypothetical protein